VLVVEDSVTMAFVSGVSLGTSRFAGQAVAAKTARSTGTVMMAMSKSIPFLECPKNLNGSLPGDVGFDPLYLSDNINLNYARASVSYLFEFFFWFCSQLMLVRLIKEL